MSYRWSVTWPPKSSPCGRPAGCSPLTPAYYAWLANPISERDLEDAYLTDALIYAHGDDPEFGYRFLADELERASHVVG